MFGRRTRAAKRAAENGGEAPKGGFPSTCCQICGRELEWIPEREISTNEITGYKAVGYYNSRLGKWEEIPTPVYAKERVGGYEQCPVHGHSKGVVKRGLFW